ncbi:GIY-YIG nuclease family protein [Sphingopyxis sp.]|uniref:GIY-YIG nuclease family protein n=1 Tax=Sphingopyxis sp. TaxID=1908224 RepID=UPI003D6D537B
MKSGAVYIMANRKNGAIYTGSTSKLVQRVYQHREMLIEGFTKTHGCKLLAWFEVHEDLQEARLRELQIKRWKRSWKVRMIEEANPDWRDLWFEIQG